MKVCRSCEVFAQNVTLENAGRKDGSKAVRKEEKTEAQKNKQGSVR
jgi:hypothetical protein